MTAPRPSARIETVSSPDAHDVTITPPDGFRILDATASPVDGASIVVEGKLEAIARSASLREYVVRGRAGLYERPSRSALVGYVPGGTVVQARTSQAPSHSGWIALDDDESFMLDDGSLVLRSRQQPAVVPFATKVHIPADADLSRASMHHGERRKFEVVFSPRVAIRAGKHSAAGIIGALSAGDVVEGFVDEVDPNWLCLSDPSGGKGFVMIEHQSLGPLLRPLKPPANRGVENGTFVVRIPRHRVAPQRSPAPKRIAPAMQARAPTARGGETARRSTTTDAGASAGASAGTSTSTASPAAAPGEANARADLAAARRAEKRCKGASAQAGASAVEALSGESLSVLCECPASPENVQSPKESVEAWVAVEDGGFAPMATA